MSQETKNIRIQSRADFAQAWTQENPVLLDQEIGYEQDTGRYKMGDGITPWNNLSYFSLNGKNINENNIIFNDLENNWVDGAYSIATGKNVQVGLKGYYIKAINIQNKVIFISNTKTTPVITTSLTEHYEEDFITPAYAVGDSFSMIATREQGKRNHYHFVSTIETINNNKIKYTTELPFSTIVNDTWERGNTFFVASKPQVGTVSISDCSFGEGEANIVAGENAHAEGYNNIAAGNFSHSEGRNNKSGYAAHSEGYGTKAAGNYSHTEGYSTQTLAPYSHAEGYETYAYAQRSHAEGYGASASGEASHAEGHYAKTQGEYSHAEGSMTNADGASAHAEGTSTVAKGASSHAEGSVTQAIGSASHAEGVLTQATAQGAHAEGIESIATNMGAHAEGHATAEGLYSHAENRGVAKGEATHAEGQATAEGLYSHAEGFNSKAIGAFSHAQGYCVEAHGKHQHAEGRLNLIDKDNTYAHIVGNGSTSTWNRSNAHTLDWNGNAWFAGNITSSATNLVNWFKDNKQNITGPFQLPIYIGKFYANTLKSEGNLEHIWEFSKLSFDLEGLQLIGGNNEIVLSQLFPSDNFDIIISFSDETVMSHYDELADLQIIPLSNHQIFIKNDEKLIDGTLDFDLKAIVQVYYKGGIE